MLVATTAFAQVVESPTRPVEVLEKVQSVDCSCIKIARLLGAQVPQGSDAKDLVPNSRPVIGGLVLLRYGTTAHVALLEGFKGGFQVAEGNFVKGPCVPTRRTIAFDDPHVQGFWYNNN